MRKSKLAVAMSGGVDSGMAAALLVKEGYQCTGFHMHLWSETVKSYRYENKNLAFGKNLVDSNKVFVNKCCSTESLEVARKTAHQLGIPFQVIDFSPIFKKRVVDYFLKAYALGLTPNPCIFCNKFIKFGELLNYIRKLGFDYLATGHYAKNETSQNLSGSLYYSLLAGKDKSKDQSYFLYNLTQSQLAHILFPVGNYQKKEVVALAKKWQLPMAHRPESQEICFLPENDYRPFLKRHISSKIIPGEAVDIKRKMIGRHEGLPLYTIGQRHGFEVNSKVKSQKSKLIPPFYVIGKDVKKNQLIVGFGQETERKDFLVSDVSWINPNYPSVISHQPLFVRIRHQGNLLEAQVLPQKTRFKVVLAEPERGIAPGQAAVFYLGEGVLGGGIITDYPLTKEKKND